MSGATGDSPETKGDSAEFGCLAIRRGYPSMTDDHFLLDYFTDLRANNNLASLWS